MGARIALVHAVKVAIAPVEDAFRRHWPEAELINLLDDSLSRDRNREGALTPQLTRRIAALAEYGIGAGAYHMKLLLQGGQLFWFAQSILQLRRRLRASRRSVLWEAVGATKYGYMHLSRSLRHTKYLQFL